MNIFNCVGIFNLRHFILSLFFGSIGSFYALYYFVKFRNVIRTFHGKFYFNLTIVSLYIQSLPVFLMFLINIFYICVSICVSVDLHIRNSVVKFGIHFM